MKTRRWVLVIALFVGFILLLLYHGWNFFNLNGKILNYIEENLRYALGESFSIERLDLSIGAIHLKNVDLDLREGYYHLHVDDIRFGFNFFNLVKHGFRVERIPQDVIFIKPYLSIHSRKGNSQQTGSLDSTLKAFDTNQYLRKLENLHFVNRITISKGKIAFVDTAKQSLLLATDINGWLSASNVEKTTIRLVGKIFNSDNFNLSLSGYANLKQGRLDTLNARVTNYAWSKEDAFFLPEYYDIRQGVVNGILTLNERISGRAGFDIKGSLSIRQGEIVLPEQNLSFDNISVETEVRDWNLYVRDATARMNGSPIRISGMIKNILNPELNLILESKNFDVGKLVSAAFPRLKDQPEGLAHVKIEMTNTFPDPHIDTAIFSRSIRVKNHFFRDCRLHFSYRDSVLTVQSLSLSSDRLRWQGDARFDFARSSQMMQFQLTADGMFPNKLIRMPLETMRQSRLRFSATGRGKPTDFSTNIALMVQAGARDTLASFNGYLQLREKLFFWSLNDAKRNCRISGEYNIAEKPGRPVFKVTGLNHIVQGLPEYRKFLPYFHFKESVLTISKKGNSWLVGATLVWNGNPDLTREVDASFVFRHSGKGNLLEGKFRLLAENTYYPGKLSLFFGEKSIRLKTLAIEGLIIAEGEIGKGADGKLSGQIIFPNAPAADLARIIFRESRGVGEGVIYGSIGFAGSLKNPVVLGKFDLNDMVFNGIGAYAGSIRFQVADRILALSQLDLNRNGEKLIRCAGTYNFSDKSLNFNLNGKNIDANSTLMALYHKDGLLSGTADVDLTLRGAVADPRICGTINIANGRFTRFSFDRLVFTLVDRDAFAEGDSLRKVNLNYPALRIGNFSFARAGEFQITGRGLLPLKSENPIDLDFHGAGNLLSILPEFTSFFKETRSEGTWSLHLRGLPGSVRIVDSKVNLRNGYLRLGDVAPEIKDIALSVQSEPDGFVYVANLSGKIRRREFKFRNQRVPANPVNEKFKPFEIPFLNLNLGIFTIETSPKGIPLHIPGLMDKGEFGRFIFLGKNKSERFTVTGPAWQPYVRGKLILQNANFTFPFISQGNPDKSAHNPVVRVLRSIDWDVLALTGKDLHYQRQIPSGLDNVYLDLIVDAGVGGLNFKGIIRDNTFGATGLMESSRGNVEYLNLNFQITKAGAEFDMEPAGKGGVAFDKTTLLPIVYGEARTTVIDSTGFPYYIYLTLLTRDRETGQTQKRGRLGEMVFQLSSENQKLGGAEGEILASLGYSTKNMKEMATDLLGISADNLLFRPLFRPFERELERRLGLDMVRFSSRFTRNLIEMNVSDQRNFQIDSKLFLLRSTKVMIGKYLLNQIFFTYSGQLEAGMNYRYQHEGFGLSHKFGLEYRISPSLLLQMEYDYNSLLLYRREDKKILLRHSFPF
ncbi:MAG: hypothetical protein GXO74_03000 [Calditrichaeota bacterium]|nr:hypothetical protein [Calditrichota bacterium]